jgi:hypothetical protein
MITPQFIVEVDDRKLLLHLEKLPATLRTNLRTTIAKLTEQLLAQVRSIEPSRTGRLRSQTRGFVDETKTMVRGRVRVLGTAGAPNIAAAALEYGSHKSIAVKAYQRKGVAVRAYERRTNITAQRFLHGPFAAMRERALAEIKAAVNKSVEESAT